MSASVLYGALDGAQSDWFRANFHDRGRVHLQQSAELASTGLKAWDSAPAPAIRPLRRMFGQHHAEHYAEPIVRGAHASYFQRRATSADEPQSFRRSLQQMPDPGPLRLDKPEGKRALPEPHGPPPHVSSRGIVSDEIRFKASGHEREPAMPRLSRPIGTKGLRESDQELMYDRAMGRKVRLDLTSYRGRGRAGDLSHSFAPPRRPEEEPNFFKSLKDSPTFIRFCNSLPPRAVVTPHERRTAELHRNHASEVQRERELVATLTLPNFGDE
ncbi:hypothetical protein CEUSTIGMA_g7574.t1 [Chlamydomonas eustigma]|uniref:Uncharacterized protein n=1 Tax=Chlamydomonas eustigma TaxID=1157962 RepID=A0A250XAR7_9CHLO|nr:hypothetical protein CEUSTIGMA_g7574.t1 [Chlamydomonas eustigma]|eukprot:GAX80136.1 hypothetical protein CEUSTIGMA_g7574.t1 [Chlamydomonas eustigma]